MQQALKRKGTTLILAPLPPRGLGLLGYDTAALRPYPDLQGYDPEDALRGYEAGLEPLTVAGLRVANLAAAASKTPRYFFKRDHHWTPAGAKASAEAVAEVIGSRGKRTFSNRPQALAAQLGSYGEAVAHICPQAPAKETFEQYQPPRDNPKGETLFSKTALPIALVGTSNSALPQWNFAGFLAAATGLEVLNVSLEGGGPSAPLLAYVRSQDFQERPPKVLVWEYATLFDTPADPLFYRQLLPSVAGPCKAPLAQVETATSASFPPLFEKPDARARYLRLHLSDLSQLKPRLHIAYQSGREETVTLTRSPRERNDGVFYLRFAGVPKTVNLRLAAHAKGTAQAQLCR